MIRKFWNADKVVSICALIISIATLYISFKQHSTAQEQQRLSVMPYLISINYGTGSPNFKLVIENNGLGPAFIESVKVLDSNKTSETDLIQYLAAYHQSELDSIFHLVHSNIYKGMMIPAGTKVEHLAINNSQEDANKLLNLLYKLAKNGLNYEIIYSSIYKERWRLNLDEGIPQKIE